MGYANIFVDMIHDNKLVRMCHRKLLLAAIFLMLVFVPSNPSYYQGMSKEEDVKWKNVPWVQNSIVLTKRIQQPDMSDLSLIHI